MFQFSVSTTAPNARAPGGRPIVRDERAGDDRLFGPGVGVIAVLFGYRGRAAVSSVMDGSASMRFGWGGGLQP